MGSPIGASDHLLVAPLVMSECTCCRFYDEYLVAYRDRQAVPHRPRTRGSSSSGSVTFQHALVVDGHVAGTWRVTRSAAGVAIRAVPLRRLNSTERRALTAAVQRYERFVELPVTCSVGAE